VLLLICLSAAATAERTIGERNLASLPQEPESMAAGGRKLLQWDAGSQPSGSNDVIGIMIDIIIQILFWVIFKICPTCGWLLVGLILSLYVYFSAVPCLRNKLKQYFDEANIGKHVWIESGKSSTRQWPALPMGIWKGYFKQFGERHQMTSFEIEFKSGKVRGNGKDEVGSFRIDGG
jgi:hypothetical protein